MIDKDKVDLATTINQMYVNNQRNKLECYDDDSHKSERIEQQLCKYCFYFRRDEWAGQSFTNSKCKSCDKEMTFATTSIDNYCIECAKEYGVCKHCGAKMD